MVASRSGLEASYVDKFDEGGVSKQIKDLYSTLDPSNIRAAAQRDVLLSVSNEGSAVIVGRTAAVVLAGVPPLLRIFVYGKEEDRAKSIQEEYGGSREAAAKRLHQTDSRRV